MNGATAFLDGSTIYGSTEERINQLRTFDAGLMKTSYGDLLPMADEDDCGSSNKRYFDEPR